MKALLLSILSCLLLCSCATPHGLKTQVAVDARLSEAVYATRDSMDAGRFDLAYKYSNEAARLVSPPKKRIPIASIYADY